MLEQMALNDTDMYPKLTIVQLIVTSASIHPLVEEAVMHLIPFSFFNFSKSQLPPLNTIKDFVPSPFAASPIVT